MTITLLAACSLAPDYHPPQMSTPESYKEGGNWLPATPDDAKADRGAWWKNYNDDELNALEDKVTTANQNLQAALARYEQARAAASVARADYFPTLTANGNATREKLSRSVADVAPKSKFNDFAAGADLSYELDVWGRVRNAVAAGENRADASSADLGAMDLSLHAELAMDYFALRGFDASQKILDETVADYDKALQLTKARFEGGASNEMDVDQAQTQLENAKTQAADTRLKRAQMEHAIAVLTGETPSSFTLTEKPDAVPAPVPSIPSLPSSLLQKRPDIAAAEFRMQAANAEIGVARAAYFPDFTFSADGGYESALAPKLLKAPSLFWAFGPSVTLPLFDGGRISALSDQAHAVYDETVANYKQTVLTAFQEVEDNLVALHRLGEENDTQAAAVASSGRALAQAQNRYKGGIATYLDVVVEQNTALQAELAAIDIRTRQLTASVLLVKALGGSWQATAQTTAEKIPQE